jgi:CRISPR/Cas system-associated exonuclease Cas4 (RecB family)
MQGLTCHKKLWLSKNKPELNPNTENAITKRGVSVGELARDLFTGGELVEFGDFGQMLDTTKELLNSQNIIYEASFSGGGGFAMVDILVKNGNKWDIYEVKSSTSLKRDYIIDSSYQRFVAEQNIAIAHNYIVYINNNYKRENELDIQQLFTIENITDKVLEVLPKIPEFLQQQEVLQSDEPETVVDKNCLGCEYQTYCLNDCLNIPEKSVFNLYNCRNKINLYQQNKITYLDLASENFSAVQLAQIQEKEIINTEVLQDFISEIIYPIYFFDFETFGDAVPRLKGQKPYKQIPFQYSLHILDENGNLEHYEFLAKCNEDPREKLAKNMLKVLGGDLKNSGTIMAFNQSFEISRIKDLAEFLPEYKSELLALIPRFNDLIIPFRKLGYYHPDMNGSFSIKSVLPAMFSDNDELDYKKLGCVQNGGEAMDVFANLYLETDEEKIQQIREDLLKYCHLDTLAMVRIWQKLKDLLN